MITLVKPRERETVALLRPTHLAYIKEPQNDPVAAVDWLNLREGKEDMSYPLPVRFEFSPAVKGSVRVWEDGKENTAVIASAEGGVAEVWNLRAGRTYLWQVDAEGEASSVGSFQTDSTAPTMFYVDGISNVRDMGGFRTKDGGCVRCGKIYRTSEMDRHVNITEEGKETMYALGMKTDLDIRGKGECPHAVLDRTKVDYINIPLAAYDARFTREQMERYRETYLLLTAPSVYPVFIHCWGGIDRTGTWLYILGAMLGMKEEDLGLDYELSSFSRWGKRSRRSEQFEAFLAGLGKYGDNVNVAAVNFLRACGVTDEQMDKIRSIMIGK